MSLHKRINADHRLCQVPLSQNCFCGDKEITVRIRSNRHYRIKRIFFKSECLSVCDKIRLSGKWERRDLRYGRVSLVRAPGEGAFFIILLCQNTKGNDEK